jgi:hypothetical protein
MVDDPAHYRWSSYRHNALGQANRYLVPHPLYLELGRDDKTRQAAYRSLFRVELDQEPESVAKKLTKSLGWIIRIKEVGIARLLRVSATVGLGVWVRGCLLAPFFRRRSELTQRQRERDRPNPDSATDIPALQLALARCGS